jgi:hypothetical protein
MPAARRDEGVLMLDLEDGCRVSVRPDQFQLITSIVAWDECNFNLK